MLLLSIIGATLAYLFTETDTLENKFIPAKVSCEVEEEFDGNKKTNVSIKNTGETDAYIRAAIVITWVADDDNNTIVYAKKPQEDVDYTIEYNTEQWIKDAENGFYYYPSAVASGESTKVLIESCTVISGREPEGYHLSVEIVASAIQSSPETVVEGQWGVTVEKGKIVE